MAGTQYSRTYSFQDITAAFSGPFGAFAFEGEANEGITVSFRARNTMTEGADGGWMHSLHAFAGGSVTVRLLKTSYLNATLNKMFRNNTVSSRYHGNDTITIEDPVRGDQFTLVGCAITKHPDDVYAVEGNVMEWTWDVGKIVPTLGDGAPVSLT